jgi:hypothetical protein
MVAPERQAGNGAKRLSQVLISMVQKNGVFEQNEEPHGMART